QLRWCFGDLPADELGFCPRAVRRSISVPPAGGECGFVFAENYAGRSGFVDLAIFQPEDALAEAANLIHLVADENDRPSAFRDILHLAQTFFLELEVADSEYFIYEKNFRLERGGHGKCQPHLHSRAEIFERRIEITF